MSRLEARFAALREAGRKGLVTFVTAGDPDAATTVRLMHALVGAGADVIELGVPFSDPMADGPVIQRASERALAAGMTLRGVLECVRAFRARDRDTPVVLMGYLNPIEVTGYRPFAAAAAAAGVDGVLTVDLPPEEAGPLIEHLRGQALDPIFLLAPTSDERRIERVCASASGFVYYVSLKGVTGAGHLDFAAVAGQVERIRAHTALPVGVGFGIRDGASAARIGALSDAVVVGSAIVERAATEHAAGGDPAVPVTALVAEMRAALDALAAGGGR